MRLPRASGVLLHPTSLPGQFGIGDLGPEAHRFVSWLADAGQRWWQMLPLGPTGYGNSPYQSYSSHAGNALLISPEALAGDGWLTPDDWADAASPGGDSVDFDAVIPAKQRLFRTAFERFQPDDSDFAAFRDDNASWLHDYTLYMALKEHHRGAPWYEWEPGLVARDPEALTRWRERLDASVRYYEFLQYAFARQWQALRSACNARDIRLIGDLPIFVAQDSADVWARPDLFQLDQKGWPTVVAGVPPDYFATTGQLWGNPLYDWDAHLAEDFAWWIDRLKGSTRRVDLVRLDHFRGFEAYWEVPAGAPTAAKGRWVPAPGVEFLRAVRDAFGGLPLIAEDLGDITPEVYELRDRFELPGMRVLQFAFGGETSTDYHRPHQFPNHCVVYTGTHDNDTAVGWFRSQGAGTTVSKKLAKYERTLALRYLGTKGRAFHWDLIRLAFSSVADTAIVPLQDVLGLDGRARMNVPGWGEGNWQWRVAPGQLTAGPRDLLADMTALYSRWNGATPARYLPPKLPEPKPKRAARRQPAGGLEPTSGA